MFVASAGLFNLDLRLAGEFSTFVCPEIEEPGVVRGVDAEWYMLVIGVNGLEMRLELDGVNGEDEGRFDLLTRLIR